GRTALIAYYAAFAAAHGSGRPGDLSAMADVHEAAGAALAWAEEAGRWADVSALARGLSHFYYMRRMTDEYRAMLQHGLRAAEQAGRARDKAWFLLEQGVLADESGAFAEAIDLIERSV